MAKSEKTYDAPSIAGTLLVTAHGDSALSESPVKITKRELEDARNRAKLADIELKAKLSRLNQQVGFVISKLIGVAGIVVGGLEILDPQFLSIVLKYPEAVCGVGLALLTGKSLISRIARLTNPD